MMDERDKLGCFSQAAFFGGVLCLVVLFFSITKKEPIVITSESLREFFSGIGPYMEALMTPLSIVAGIGAALAFVQIIMKQLHDAFKEPIEAALTDKRKKKKDEYDAYYDERLALDESPAHPLEEIAYYEEVRSSNVVSG